MKKWEKVFLVVGIYYVSYKILDYSIIDNKLKNIVELIFLSIPILLALFALIYIFIIKKILKYNEEKIIKLSLKINKLLQLNEEYGFKQIVSRRYSIVEREYSRKSLDRATASSIIKYHIENNIDSLRTDIENAIYNIEILDNYSYKVKEIEKDKSIGENNTNFRKYNKIEKYLFNKNIYKKEDFQITLKLEVFYESNKGNVREQRYGKYNFDDLIDFYLQWKNGNKYEETIKQERKIMNDDIRYNVLKRDNYTCQLPCTKSTGLELTAKAGIAT